MESISAKFAAAVKSLLAQAERGAKSRLAKTAGLSFTQFSDLLTGRRNGTEEQRRAVAMALAWEYEELLRLGEGLLSGQDYQKSARPPGREFFKIPLVGLNDLLASLTVASADFGSFIMAHPSILGRKSANRLRALKIDDDAMEPLIAKGGLVVVDLKPYGNERVSDNAVYVVCRDLKSGACELRQVEAIRKGLLALKSPNPAIAPVYTKLSEIRLSGRVIWTCRGL